MTFTYTLTRDEILAGLKRRAARLRAQTSIPLRVSAVFWIAVVLLLFALFQLWDTLDRAGGVIAGDLTLFAVLFVLGVIAARAYRHIAAKLQIRHFADEIHAAAGEQRLEVEADSVALSSATASSRFHRSLIESIAVDQQTTMLYIFLKGGSSIWVPRRAFASDEEQRNFIAQLQPQSASAPRPAAAQV